MPGRGLLLPLILLAVVCCAGCFEVEETLTINRDGSGKVEMHVLFPQVAMRWLPGKPSADWLRPGLPEGVSLTSFEHTQDKTTFIDPQGKEHKLDSEVYEFGLAFNDVAALNAVRVRPDQRNAMAALAGSAPGRDRAMMARPTADRPDAGPFQNITLTRDGDLMRFRRVIQAARDPRDIEADRMSTPGTTDRPQVFDLGKSVLKISVTCPGPVTEHNADEIDGRTLTWVFKLRDLQERQDRDWIVGFTCRAEDAS